MSRGTVRPERSSHKRIVSAEEAWVVTRRICGGRRGQSVRRRSMLLTGQKGHEIGPN